MPEDGEWAVYNGRYFDNAHGGHQTSRMTTAFFSAVAQLRAAHVSKYLTSIGVPTGSAVLEVGPGMGVFAGHWLRSHPGTHYWAIESDRSCHEALSILGVQLLESSAAMPAGQLVDLVVMSHVLEHITRPLQALNAIAERLRPGGVLFLEVPCRDFEHKRLDEPHVLFFDKAPMRTLLERLGFDRIHLSYHGQTIKDLRNRHPLRRVAAALRHQLISKGLTVPFGTMPPGLEAVTDRFERAVVKPYLAHIEQNEPAWWLRALAVRGED